MSSVLIVDDSLTVRMDLAEAFEEGGFSVETASSLGEARQRMQRAVPEAVVLDLRLPDGDGLEFLKELRKAHGDRVAVLMLSSAAEVQSRLRGLHAGADDYVGKPYDRVYLVQRARELVGGSSPESSHCQVLIIDDSLTFRETLRHVLQAAGYRVLVAASGEEGLALASRHRPTAVLVDGHLPGIDGATVIRRLRLDAALRRTPCIMLTGSEERGDEVRTLEAGADAFVRKSEDLRGLLARLATACREGPSRAPEPSSSLLGPKRILVVEQGNSCSERLAEALSGETVDVARAHSSHDVLEFLKVQPADCIVIDSQAEGALALCREIKAVPGVGEIPLLMLVLPDDQQTSVECLNAGADDTMAANASGPVLRARVQAQLRRKQFEDEKRTAQAARMEREMQEALVQARERMIEELEQKNKELESFSYSVSHDLRAPLRAIEGFSHVLEQQYADRLDQKGRDYLQRVRGAAKRMSELIDDLLGLSRLSRVPLRRQPCDLSETARTILEQLREQAPERLIDLQVQPGITVEADPGLLKVLLENVLSNAWKFTSRQALARIEVRQEADGSVCVQDNGAGFERSTADKLFAPFQRFHTTAEFEGTGIGLAFVQRIVARHHGRIQLNSRPGEGTCVCFDLRPAAL